MKQTLEVSRQCELLKQEINDIVENTFPARILQVLGSLIRRITRRSVSPPWFVTTILLAVLAVLPQALLAFFSKTTKPILGKWLDLVYFGFDNHPIHSIELFSNKVYFYHPPRPYPRSHGR